MSAKLKIRRVTTRNRCSRRAGGYTKVMDPRKLSTDGRHLFERIEFDDKEKLLVEIRKHPFGLLLRYITGTLVIIVFSAVFFIVPAFTGNDTAGLVGVDGSAVQAVMALVGLVLVTLAIAVTFISAYLYKTNVLLVTSDKLAQVLNVSLFNRKISQLSIGDVQDISVHQNGFFPRILNYGTIFIETAGEQSNLKFTFAPDPYKKSKVIVNAHEENLKLYGN